MEENRPHLNILISFTGRRLTQREWARRGLKSHFTPPLPVHAYCRTLNCTWSLPETVTSKESDQRCAVQRDRLFFCPHHRMFNYLQIRIKDSTFYSVISRPFFGCGSLSKVDRLEEPKVKLKKGKG